MAKTIKEERLRWVLPIARKELRMVDAAKVCPYGKRSVERWVAAYKHGGEDALEPQSTEPKTQPAETPIRTKERIIEVRKQTKKCALKIHWQLAKEGLMIPTRTIGKILKKEGLVRTYRVKKVKYIYLRAERKPGELIEIDVKYVPGRVAGRRYFQYTAIDTASRWRHLAVYDEQSSYHSIRFLTEVLALFPHCIHAIKTDNGAIFTNYYVGATRRSDMTVKTIHGFDRFCAHRGIVHYLIDPGKPAQNGTVERIHREDEEKLSDFERKGNHWLELMRNWIIEANQAENLSKQENLSGARDFLVSIGSNRRLSAGILLAEFKTPWNFLAETNAEGRSPEATSSANQIWWDILNFGRTYFERN